MHRYLIICAIVLLQIPTMGACWTEYNVQGMVRDVKNLIPDNLSWVLEHHEEHLRTGLSDRTIKFQDRRQCVQGIVKESQIAVGAFTKNRSYSEGVSAMGRIVRMISLLHEVVPKPASLLNPDWATDYAVFLQKKRSYFRIRWLGVDQRPHSKKDLKALLLKSSQKMDKVSNILTETLNREKKEIAAYDVRSTPFGIGSMAYSSSVNTIALTWLYIWDQVGGIQDSGKSSG